MGLYLCVFSDDEEIEGVEVGGYDDFAVFRDAVCAELEGGKRGSRFPHLQLHSDCDGAWDVQVLPELGGELRTIRAELEVLPAKPYAAEWQIRAAQEHGLVPSSRLDSFIDVDGELLVDRLLLLVAAAQQTAVPIWFQ
jgi:hypothetical protein